MIEKSNISTILFMHFTHFLFPKICPHCQSLIENEEGIFCKNCAFYFEPLNPKFRCFYCFIENEKRLCEECRKNNKNMIPRGAVWEYFGPITTFLQKLKREQTPSLIKLASAFFALQYERLNFPKSDMIVPVPSFALNVLWKGKSLNDMIGKIVSHILMIPLKQCIYTFSPVGNIFKLKKRSCIEGKNLLLIDVDLPAEDKWQNLFETLREEYPRSICGLTLSLK